MAEINNNISGYGINREKIEIRGKEPEVIKDREFDKNKEAGAVNYVPDTGVLGRSQVKNIKHGDVSRSVDEAVELMRRKPIVLDSSDKIFDILYNSFLKEGLDPSEAYIKALLAQEEFIQAGIAVSE